MFKSIKAPISIAVTLSMSVMAALVLWFAVLEYKSLYLKLAHSHTVSLANGVIKNIAPSMLSNAENASSISELLFLLKEHEHVISVRVYSGDYSLLLEEKGPAAIRLNEPFLKSLDASVLAEDKFASNNVIVSRRTIGSAANPDGFLMLLVDAKAPLSASIKGLLFNVAPLIFILWLLSIVGTLFFIHRLFRPLGELSVFTKQVTDTKDYALRQNLTSRDEIGTLGENINRLLEMIEVELLINHEQNQTLVDQQETMIRLANYDSLTGLPNRQLVLDNLRLELARARRNGYDLALLFFDLDGFKGINDSLGHETGDLILIEVADRVSALLREGDLVARLGGDEFLVLPDRETRDSSLEHMASRLIDAFSDPFELRGLSLSVGVSVGVARAIDADYDLSDLMSNADLAMYRSKANGRGSYTIFTPDMVESHKRKFHIANAIEQGLRDDEFLIYYQVKVDKAAKVIGLEALLRWQHPEYGMVMPNEFIPIAEQGGKISAITRWVIDKVCQDLPELRAWLPHRFRVSMNLSGHDLRDSNLFDNIYEIFTRHNVNPEFVEFEVTESAYLENFASSNKFFKRMSNMGCAIALDDFGTGYSSLSYLTQISIDTLKIDKQFVHELETSERSRLVMGAIIDLAKRLSLNVCAEGIENKPQWHYLTEHGCDYIQGFMFSKPIPMDELIKSPKQYVIEQMDTAGNIYNN
ncbi:EAL domain-containing protein [Alteromonas sp. 1_MG-2023]|uniref:EAL domain-containing protein n=1 Tax=Alteromonas sp. 1_MG-2023 TaxID=3062669 RepID=UPI0026E36E1E|nr:EAL domain-containing protein [Alteromonas sp. 1_MG-2023]MDO6567038.1 EAL domain-containing protein [Alteromonas sp. 1_MG-2023]